MLIRSASPIALASVGTSTQRRPTVESADGDCFWPSARIRPVSCCVQFPGTCKDDIAHNIKSEITVTERGHSDRAIAQ